MLLWLQRPPHHEGGDASSSTLYQDWWILLNTILRSCPDLQGWVQQQLYPFTEEAETWPPIASPVFWPIVFRLHSPPPTEVEKLDFTRY